MSAKDFGAAFEIEDFVEDLHDAGFVVSAREDGLPEVRGPSELDAARAQFLNDNGSEIARYLACERARARFAKPIEARGPQELVPLTAQQHAMWLSLSLAGGTAPTYHTPTVLRLTGTLDISRLTQALTLLFERHDVLRTVIVEEDGVPFQRVTEPVPVHLKAREVALADVDEAVRAVAVVPFDLGKGPLVRTALFRHGPGDHTLLLLQHHLVSDGWTIALLARELGALYSEGAEALAPPKLQYADYALWQHEALAGNAVAPLAQYWAEILAGWSPLELASDRPRVAARSDTGAHHHFHIPRPVVAALERLARDHRTTLFSVVAAAFVGLLRIQARQDDVTILTAVAGRSKRELADLAGYFVNLLPLRAQCGSSEPFAALVDQVSAALVDAQSHADVPYADIVKAAAVAREGSGRTALERAVLVFQSSSAGPAAHFQGLDVTVDPEADLPIAKFELTFSLSPTDDGLEGRAEYATDRYDRATITTLCEHFGKLLDTLARDPQTRLTGGALLDAPTFEAVVTASNRTTTPYPRDATLTELFAAVAEEHGDAIAVRDGGEALTYRDLDAWSDAVAATLLECGATMGEEPMVALRMGRGAPLLAAILGVLKAGAAYVPIDPLYPQDRALMMIKETRAGALIVPTRTADDEAIAPDGCTLLSMDAIGGIGPVPAPARTPSDLAYVCFTSGTTGTPKGVLVPHRAVVRLVQNSNVIAPKVGERIAFASNAVFDAVTLEIWGALLSGATLVVVDQDTLLDPDRLAAHLANERVDYLWLTAALFDQMAGHRPDMFGHLKTLYAGGSALNPDMVRRVLTCPTGAPGRFVNGYGPTENTTFSTIHPVANVPDDARTIPIGRPISNALAFVLDEGGRPVPPGVVGELHVGGDGLARGYLNDPAATAAKFTAHTFTHPETGASITHRLYATGDLVRWRDNALDFVGRNDRQVKLHGFRVEPGEVEFTIGQCPGVVQAVAQIVHGDDGHPRLLAWFTSAPDSPVSVDDLRRHLKRILPPYMVPSALVPLDRMPVNTSGKVDLGALPMPDFKGAQTEAADAVEEALLEIWRAVLRTDAIGVDDDFFSVGGDSILTIQVVASARAKGFHVSPRDIFQARTVAGLAARVSHEAAIDSDIAPAGPPALTPIQRWFFTLDLAAPEHFNQAFLLLPPHEVTGDALAGAVGELVARHDALRQRFSVSADGEHQVSVVPPGTPDLALVEEIAVTSHAALQERLTALQSRLSPQFGPMVAAALVRGCEDGRARILVAIHHLAVDIVSWRILVGELATLLAPDGGGCLPAPTTPFAAWSGALARAAATADVAQTLSAWQAMLEPAQSLPRPDTPRTELQTLTLQVELEESRTLLRDCADAYGTRVDELILAAFAPALGAACGAADAAIMLEGHGREPFVGPDVSSTVGWFTTRYPVRFAQIGDATAQDAIITVKDTLRRIPHNGLSYGLVTDVPNKGEPDVLFNYLGQLDATFADGWSLAPEEPGAMVSPRNRPTSPLDVTAFVLDERLAFRFVDEGGRPPGWLERLAEDVAARLRAVIAHCAGRKRIDVTASDFAHVGLTREELGSILAHEGSAPEDILPLAPLQEGLLFHALHSPQSDQYLVQFEWPGEAAIHPERMGAAWQALALAFPVLRTRFVWRGLETPVQVVEPGGSVAFRVVDLSDAADEAGFDEALDQVRKADRAKGIDLSQVGAFRVTLIRRSDRRWVLLWTHHHIIIDGWSVPLVFAALARCYATGKAPPETVGYAQYFQWLRRQDVNAALGAWGEMLSGLEGPTDIPVLRPGASLRKHTPIVNLGVRNTVLSERLTERLTTLARAERVTLNAVIQLAWAHLLAGYAGGVDDVVFGTVVSGRGNDCPGIETAVGLIANVVPLRVRTKGDDTVSTALQNIHGVIETAGHNAHVPLVDIEATAALSPDVPLFHSATVFENYPDVGAGNEALGAGRPRVTDKTSFPLLLMAIPGEALDLSLQFDEALFDPERIDAMLGHLIHVLDAFAARPSAKLCTIDLLDERERHAVVDAPNATMAAVDREATIVSLFAAQVTATPDAMAVEDDAGRTMTYAALDAAASHLAHRLHAAHLRLGTPMAESTAVGICLKRGHGLIVAIMAIMKAGGAYVPLDPDHPPERLAFLAKDCGASLIVTDTTLASTLPVGAERLILVDDDEPAPAQVQALPDPAPNDLAYILYTSGSTGQPKGAMIEHRALANRILWMQAAYGLTPADRVLQKTPFSFDVSVWEFVWPLVTGARLVFARPDGHKDPAYLARFICERAITTLHFVPSMLRVFEETVDVSQLTPLRLMFCSGEALPADLARAVLRALPTLQMHNLYGPTEAAIDVSYHPCSAHMEGAVVPIGRPVWNTALHVLDAKMRPAPLGVPGELWIGGVQLARGYRNRPDLTTERFVPNPLGEGRLYRTGDRVVRDEDGVLHYLGRTDFQVKVRGIRIEPGEVEAALEDVPGVAQAVVLTRDINGESELVAYVAQSAGLGDDNGVKAHLRRTLPEAMVPSRIVRMTHLPLNTAGKVDRGSLPDPQDSASEKSTADEAPASRVEGEIIEAMAQILGVSVGRQTDFFAAGGHSLRAVRLAAKLEQRLDVRVPLSAIFAHRTAAGLAEALERAQPSAAAAPIARADRTKPLPASFGQERLWVLDRTVADRSAYNVPLAFKIDGPLDADALGDALDALVARHEILRTRIISADGHLVQAIDPAEPFPLQMERVTAERLAGRLQTLARIPFDLASEHPMRAHLLRVGRGAHVLLLNIHHSATDGWSQQLLLRELGEAYRQAVAGTAVDPTPPAVQYADLAAAERERLGGPQRDALCAFWETALGGTRPMALPTDHTRPSRPSGRGQTVAFTLPKSVAGPLAGLAEAHATTPFAALAALFHLFLARWTGADDIVLATPVANRHHPAEMTALGLFMNTVAIRPGLAAADRPFADFLATVAATVEEAIAHQSLPYDQIVDVAKVERRPDRPALTPVMLIMQNPVEGEGFGAPGLTVEHSDITTDTAKFDVTLSFQEAEGGLAGTIEYAADLFDPATMHWLGETMGTLCERVAHVPTITVGELLSAITPRASGAVTSAPTVSAVHAAPEMEAVVASVWCEVLECDSVAHDRNFFDLGGTSLRLMRVQAALMDRLGREVPVLTLFENPTVAQLAAALTATPASPVDADTPSAPSQRTARQARRARRTGTQRP